MGQRMSSDNQKAQRHKPKTSSAVAGEVYVLPREEELLGRCWLLASSVDSFSPSRWFSLSAPTANGSCPGDRRAFSISPDVLSPSERARQPVLRSLNVNIHKGLSVCGYQNITIAAMSAAAAQQKKTVRVGGVQVALPPASPQQAANDAESLDQSCYVIVVVRRVSIEAELRDYATASYTRYDVKAPPVNEDERRTFGEGCLTGLLYGASVVLHVPKDADVAAQLVQLCEEAARARGVASSALQVQAESVYGAKESVEHACAKLAAEAGSGGVAATDKKDVRQAAVPASSPSYVYLVGVESSGAFVKKLRDAFPSNLASDNASGVKLNGSDALKVVAKWSVAAHQTPSAWVAMNAFLQRYEAVADSLLVSSKKR